jgi:uncharacterized protein YfkK (UPF0435 family)
LAKVPAYYQSGIDNLKTPTLEHLKLGLIQNKGRLKIINDGLLDGSVASIDICNKFQLMRKIYVLIFRRLSVS